MAFQDVTKQQIAAASGSDIDFSDILDQYPEGYLEQELAEQLMYQIVQRIRDEIGKVIDPIKEFPPIGF